jgi:hypothetical protein
MTIIKGCKLVIMLGRDVRLVQIARGWVWMGFRFELGVWVVGCYMISVTHGHTNVGEKKIFHVVYS